MMNVETAYRRLCKQMIPFNMTPKKAKLFYGERNQNSIIFKRRDRILRKGNEGNLTRLAFLDTHIKINCH